MAHSQPAEFAQHILPEEIWLDTAHAWPTLHDSAAAPALLRRWWDQAHAYSGTTDPPQPATNLHVEPCQVAGSPALLFTLPPPQARGEAFLALLVLGEAGAPRYFLLEPDPHDPRATLLTERQADAAHRHVHAPGPPPGTGHTTQQLITQVEALLAP